MNISLHPCYILHMRNYRESSLLLQIFSKDHGRIDLVANGAKRKKNQRRYLFKPYQRLLLSWSIRGELGTLRQIEPDATFTISGLQQMISCFYINEILVRLLHKYEPCPHLFASYEKTLQRLSNGYKEGIALRYFEKNMLQALGYGLILDQEGAGTTIKEGVRYYYQLDLGPQQTPPTTASYISISGRTLRALHTENIKEDDKMAQTEARRLLRYALDSHIGNKPLASRELLSYLYAKRHAT